MYCDLHTHSIFSDGTDTPEELIARAEAIGLDAIALTDHNSVSGLPRFWKAAEGKPIRAVPGVEFSTSHRGEDVHILALFVRPEHYDAIARRTALPDQWKRESNLALAEALNRDGYRIDYDALEASTPDGRVNRSHFAGELLRLGYAKSKDEIFDTLLVPGGKYYTEPKRLDALETVEFIRSLGAVSVFAHPFYNHSREYVEEFLPRAKERGLDGMEVFYPTYDDATTRLALELAEQYELCNSGGSDYHGTRKADIRLGVGRGNLRIPTRWLEALEARLPTGFPTTG